MTHAPSRESAQPFDPPLAATQPVTSQEFRRACGQFPTGVTVVTVREGAGARGMTANSFTSVSLDPPLILVSIDRRNRTHALLQTGSRFAVNLLSEAQRQWSDRFAGRQGDLQSVFDDLPHCRTADGLPLLSGTLAAFVCRVAAIHPAGDHSLVIGRVEQIVTSPGAAPLLFFDSAYRALARRTPAE